MAEEEKPPSLDDLDARLRAARAREDETTGRGADRRRMPSGLGLAVRLTSEFVAGIAAGAALGWGLDAWLGTRPWLMVVFLILGACAGVMNAYRASKGMDDTVGFGAAQRRRGRDGT
jgi:ATP synthase protein I